jgi:hypothetical protein
MVIHVEDLLEEYAELKAISIAERAHGDVQTANILAAEAELVRRELVDTFDVDLEGVLYA